MVSSMRCRRSALDGSAAKVSRTGRGVDAVMVSTKPPLRASVPIRRAAERPSGESEILRNAVRCTSAAAGSEIARSSSPGRSTLRWGPSTKSVTATRRSPPSGVQMVQMPSSAAVSEIIGPAGSAMQMLPPTVAMFQILNEARKARQHWPMSGAAAHSGGNARASRAATVQVAAISRPSAEMTVAGQPSPARSISRESAGCGSENSQVPPASHASPVLHADISLRFRGLATSVMVFRSMRNV